MARVGDGFVDAFHVAAIKDDARGTGVDQPANAEPGAGVQDVHGADDVGQEVVPLAAGDARPGGAADATELRNVPLVLHDSEGIQLRVAAARQADHLIAALNQAAHDGTAEKTAAAGNERLHDVFLAAQAANFWRKIF